MSTVGSRFRKTENVVVNGTVEHDLVVPVVLTSDGDTAAECCFGLRRETNEIRQVTSNRWHVFHAFSRDARTYTTVQRLFGSAGGYDHFFEILGGITHGEIFTTRLTEIKIDILSYLSIVTEISDFNGVRTSGLKV